jgi:hypothetical protein
VAGAAVVILCLEPHFRWLVYWSCFWIWVFAQAAVAVAIVFVLLVVMLLIAGPVLVLFGPWNPWGILSRLIHGEDKSTNA